MSMQSKPLYWITLASLTGLTLAGCAPDSTHAPSIPVVYVTEAVESTLNPNWRFSGTLQPRMESELAFRVPGQVSSRAVEVGTRVKKGDLLVQLDPSDYQQALEAAYQQWRAAEIDATQNRLDAERLERLARLSAVGDADAERQRSRAQAAEARLHEAQAQWQLQSSQVSYTRLVAPYDGMVTGIRVESAQVVAAGQPVISIARYGDLEAVIDVPEQLVGRTADWHAVVEFPSDNGVIARNARLREVSPVAHPVSRTFRVRYTVESPTQHWSFGRSVYVQVSEYPLNGDPPSHPYIELPITALLNTGTGTQVWLVDTRTGQLTAQAVQVFSQSGNRVWVTGVPLGAQVVTLGAQKLDPAIRVRAVTRALRADVQRGQS